jgi:hypothetical protein
MLFLWPITFRGCYGLAGDRVRCGPKPTSHAHPRAFDLGLKVGMLRTEPLGAITETMLRCK